MARPKGQKTVTELEAEAAALLEQAKQMRQAHLVKAGELVKKLADKGFAGFDLEQFKDAVNKIFKA